MPKLNERGIAHVSLLILLLLGIALGVYLVQQRTNLRPKAVSEPINPQVTLSLIAARNNYTVTETVPVQVVAKTDFDPANLFVVKIQFNPQFLEIASITKDTTVINTWPEEFFNNTTGTVSLIGGVYSPGYQTTPPNGLILATINFKTKAAGATQIALGNDSAIHRNSDGLNILGITNNLSLTLAEAPVATPTPLPTLAPTPTPTPTPPPTPCNLIAAGWGVISAVNEGTIVPLTVSGLGGCAGKEISFQVLEDSSDNFLLPSTPIANNPVNATFDGSNKAQSSWVAQFQQDGPFGISNPPEYYFVASIVGESSQIKSTGVLLKVNKTRTGEFKNGDGNHDGVVNLVDLSLMFTNWNKTVNFPQELDINDDGQINSVDYSGMLLILRQTGVLKPAPSPSP